MPSADQSKHTIRSEPPGQSLTWDVTVTDTIADSYLHLTSAKVGGAAENAATRKEDKYISRDKNRHASTTLHLMTPGGVDTLYPRDVLACFDL